MRTLEDINAELEQVRQKLDRARKLSAVMEDLKAQHEERKRAAEDALKVLYREQEDVEELERLSFASFLARIRGEQAERLDQERREAVAAKARYDAARRDLEDLEARFQAAQKERAGLEGLRGRWKALMEEKEDLLKYFNEWNGINPGAYEGLLRENSGLLYNHQNIRPLMITAERFLYQFNDLWTTLSRLEYIGKHKENIVVAERSRQPKETNESRWNILD